MFTFYLRYLLMAALYVVAAIKLPIVIRTIQHGTNWFLDLVENLFGIPAQYMVLADLANVDDLLNLAVFGMIIIIMYRLVQTVLQFVWDWMLGLWPKRQKQSAK